MYLPTLLNLYYLLFAPLLIVFTVSPASHHPRITSGLPSLGGVAPGQDIFAQVPSGATYSLQHSITSDNVFALQPEMTISPGVREKLYATDMQCVLDNGIQSIKKNIVTATTPRNTSSVAQAAATPVARGSSRSRPKLDRNDPSIALAYLNFEYNFKDAAVPSFGRSASNGPAPVERSASPPMTAIPPAWAGVSPEAANNTLAGAQARVQRARSGTVVAPRPAMSKTSPGARSTPNLVKAVVGSPSATPQAGSSPRAGSPTFGPDAKSFAEVVRAGTASPPRPVQANTSLVSLSACPPVSPIRVEAHKPTKAVDSTPTGPRRSHSGPVEARKPFLLRTNPGTRTPPSSNADRTPKTTRLVGAAPGPPPRSTRDGTASRPLRSTSTRQNTTSLRDTSNKRPVFRAVNPDGQASGSSPSAMLRMSRAKSGPVVVSAKENVAVKPVSEADSPSGQLSAEASCDPEAPSFARHTRTSAARVIDEKPEASGPPPLRFTIDPEEPSPATAPFLASVEPTRHARPANRSLTVTKVAAPEKGTKTRSSRPLPVPLSASPELHANVLLNTSSHQRRRDLRPTASPTSPVTLDDGASNIKLAPVVQEFKPESTTIPTQCVQMANVSCDVVSGDNLMDCLNSSECFLGSPDPSEAHAFTSFVDVDSLEPAPLDNEPSTLAYLCSETDLASLMDGSKFSQPTTSLAPANCSTTGVPDIVVTDEDVMSNGQGTTQVRTEMEFVEKKPGFLDVPQVQDEVSETTPETAGPAPAAHPSTQPRVDVKVDFLHLPIYEKASQGSHRRTALIYDHQMGALRPKQAEPGSPLAEHVDAVRHAQAQPIQYTPDGYIFYELHMVSHGPDSLPELQFGRRSSKSTGLKHYITSNGDLIRISDKQHIIPVRRDGVEPDFPVPLMNHVGSTSSSPTPGLFARLFAFFFKSRTARVASPFSGSSWDHDLERGIPTPKPVLTSSHSTPTSGGSVGWMRGVWSSMTGL